MNILCSRRALLRRGLTATAAAGLLTSGAIVGAHASAEGASAHLTAAPSAHITAHPSKDSVDSGEQFRVRGLFTINDSPAIDRKVKIQSLNANGWQDLQGARVSTGDDGRYGVRVILSREGERQLRAVGITPSPNTPNPKKRFTVTVS
jgi:hypothetical protein